MHTDRLTVIRDPLEQGLVDEIAAEQISHPIEQYQPGSERLEKLYEAMAMAQRFTYSSNMEAS